METWIKVLVKIWDKTRKNKMEPGSLFLLYRINLELDG